MTDDKSQKTKPAGKAPAKSLVQIPQQQYDLNLANSRALLKGIKVPLADRTGKGNAMHNIYSFFRDVVGTMPEQRNTDTQLVLLSSLENMVASAFSTYTTFDSQLQLTAREQEISQIQDEALRRSALDELLAEKSQIVSYSIFVGSVIGLHMLEDLDTTQAIDTKINGSNFRMGLEKYLQISFYDKLFPLLASRANEIKESNESTLVTYIAAWYKTLINTAKMMENGFQKLVADKNLTTKLEVKDFLFDGYNYSSFKIMRPEELMPGSLNDVVGLDKAKAVAKNMINNVTAYSFDVEKNPRAPFSQSAFLVSKPGEGKTFLAHCVANEFLDRCQELGVQGTILIFRSTDYGTAYQFESANNLKKWMEEKVMNSKGLVMVYAPDFDTNWVARDSPHTTGDQKQVQQVMFSIFDGTIGQRNGKWFWWSDANFIPEDAAYSRLRENAIYDTGVKTPEDCVKLMRDISLRKQKGKLDEITQEQWNEFGNICIDNGLNGRSISQLALRAKDYIMNFETPAEYYLNTTSFDERLAIDKKLSNELRYDALKDIVMNYIEFDKKRVEDERAAEYRAGVELILKQNKVQSDALAILASISENSSPEELYKGMNAGNAGVEAK